MLTFGGSALGGWVRYVVTEWITRRLGDRFPAGTLVVNVTGAFGIGVVWAFSWTGIPIFDDSEFRTFLMLGFLGGYTTVSSYALSSLTMYQEGRWMRAGVNLLGTFFLCLMAIIAGVALGEWLS